MGTLDNSTGCGGVWAPRGGRSHDSCDFTGNSKLYSFRLEISTDILLFQTVGSLVDFISGGCQATDSEDKGVALHHVCSLFQLLEEEEGGGGGNLATWMEWRFPVARP